MGGRFGHIFRGDIFKFFRPAGYTPLTLFPTPDYILIYGINNYSNTFFHSKGLKITHNWILAEVCKGGSTENPPVIENLSKFRLSREPSPWSLTRVGIPCTCLLWISAFIPKYHVTINLCDTVKQHLHNLERCFLYYKNNNHIKNTLAQ